MYNVHSTGFSAAEVVIVGLTSRVAHHKSIFFLLKQQNKNSTIVFSQLKKKLIIERDW